MTRQKERLYRVIVAGATPEGIAATNKLGELGIPVTLVDSAPDLNEKLAAEEYRLPSGQSFNFAHRPGLIRILRNAQIRTLLPARISSIKHTPQGFSVRIDRGQTFVDADRCVLCGKCFAACPVECAETGKALHYAGRTSLPGRPWIDKRRQPLCQENCPLGVNAQGYIALAAQGRYDEALAAFAKVQDLPQAYNDVGYVAMVAGRLDDAQSLFEEAQRLSPEYYPTATDNARRVRTLKKK